MINECNAGVIGGKEKVEGREWMNTYRKERVIGWEESTLFNDRNKS